MNLDQLFKAAKVAAKAYEAYNASKTTSANRVHLRVVITVPYKHPTLPTIRPGLRLGVRGRIKKKKKQRKV